MLNLKNRCLRAGLSALRASGGHKLLSPWTEGVGLIFMLHQVCPDRTEEFDPNRILRVTPEFLDSVITLVRGSGMDIVSLDEAHDRLEAGDHTKRFACFTLDDGYRDNKQYAYPIFKEREVPFTIYVPSSFPEGKGVLWWQTIQDIIAKEPVIDVMLDGVEEHFATETVQQKWDAYCRMYDSLRAKPSSEQIAFMRDFAPKYDFDLEAQCRSLIMNWDEIRELAKDPLATIGTHTMSHSALAKLSDDELRRDTEASIARLTEELGERPLHMAYPYGDATSAGPREFALMQELGFKTAVTTRKGLLFDEHRDHMTALPRVSLNGDFQAEAFISVYLSGVPFAVWNGFRHLNVG